jgi:hypothetical protein
MQKILRNPLSKPLRNPLKAGVQRTLASILSKYAGSHLWDFGVSADKVAYGAAYPNAYLSAELNSNPGPFTATTGYTAGTLTGGALPTLSIVSSLLRVTTAESNYGVAEMSFPTVVGKTYQVILGVSTISTGDKLIYRIGSTVQGLDYANASLASGATPSDYKRIFTATGTTCYVTFGNHTTPPGSFTEFNKVTCKEVYASAAAEFAATYPTHHLYQDAAGTTPAFLPTHPVGLCLDQPSGSVVLSAELNSNPGPFTATTGYTAGTFIGGALPTLSIVSSLLRVTTAESNYGVAEMSFPTVVGKTYQVILGVSTISTGDKLIYRIGSTVQGLDYANASLASGATPSDYKRIFTATGTTCYVTFGNHTTPPGSFTEFNKVTVKEVLGSRASQSTTTKRSVLTGTPLRSVFDGVDDFIRTTTGGGSSTAFSLVMGFNTTGTGVAQTLWSDRTGNTGLKLEITAANAIAFSGGNGAAIVTATGDAVSANTSYVVTAKYDGATLSVRLNGGSWATATCALSAGTAAISIGCNNEAATGYYKGALQQAVYIKDTLLTDSEMQVAERAVNTAIGGAF